MAFLKKYKLGFIVFFIAMLTVAGCSTMFDTAEPLAGEKPTTKPPVKLYNPKDFYYLLPYGSLNQQLTEHFKVKEFYPLNDPWACCGNLYLINKNLVNALDTLRAVLGVPIQINSAVRSKQKQITLNPNVLNSDHLRGDAVDFEILSNKATAELQKDFSSQGEWFKLFLTKYDINAFGLYGTHFHIGINDKGGQKQLNGAEYQYWDYRNIKSPNLKFNDY